MNFKVAFCNLMAFAAVGAFGAEPRHAAHSKGNLNPWTGEGVSLGGILFPEIHYQAAAGTSSTNPADLAVGHHDPDRHGITQQDIEFALAAQLGEHVRLFGRYSTKIDQDDHWQDEFEEYYAEVSGLPFEISLKGGRLYTQFGYDNTLHPHEYTFVDKYLASGRLIGEDSATIYGGQISLPVLGRVLPVGWSDRLSFSLGTVPDVDEEEHGHAHEEEESRFEGGEAAWKDTLATANYTLTYAPRKAVRYEGGVSAAWGSNHFDRQTEVYGAHFQYLWKPSDDTKEFLRWRTEGFVRRFGATGTEEEEVTENAYTPYQPARFGTQREFVGYVFKMGGFFPIYRTVRAPVSEAVPSQKITTTRVRERAIRDDFTDAGFYSALTYGFPSGHVEAHLRGEYVSGVADAGLPERYRVSPALTWRPGKDLPIYFKLQYNYDHLPETGNEHSVWLQFNFTWGDSCSHVH